MATDNKSIRILVVDDQKHFVKLLSEMLAEYTILMAFNSKRTYEIAVREKPEMILLDVNLGENEPTGFEICQHLRQTSETKEIPIMVITAETNPEWVKAAFEAGATDYITKPFKIQEVTARVEKHLQTFKLSQQVQRQNRMLEEKNFELARKTRILDDSIHYAGRIQHALLSRQTGFSQFFKQSFVCYLPKDIVSGDFYWFQPLPDGSGFFAAADCTGHGVPGAFMSILSISTLTRIFREQHHDPASILDELDKEIRFDLRYQSDESGDLMDGMDIVLCHFSADHTQMTYAAANSRFFHFRGATACIQSGNRFPIGGLNIGEKKFENFTVHLQPKDRLYFFSDGVFHQLGGPFGRKFYQVQLQEMLSNLVDEPLGKVQSVFENTLLEWKGTREQTDDILLIGFEI